VVLATHDAGLMDQYDGRRLILADGRLHEQRPGGPKRN
jgi:ABC-type ATPase involved in cell division